MSVRHPIEPFVFKAIKPINFLDKAVRLKALNDAGYNLFKVPADKVTIDLLTDSGTGAMSEKQWSALMEGDESYASATSWGRFENAVKKFSGMRFVLPVHQGRAAEKIIAETFLKKGDIVVSNTLFDTTRANFEHRGALCIDIPQRRALKTSGPSKFKGDIDLSGLTSLFKKHGRNIKLIVMTLTNNSGGGQPASLKNVKAISRLAKQRRVPLLIDACRVAENAYFIWRDEVRGKESISAIIKKTFSFCDLAYMSAKKDGLANMGGFIVTNNKRFTRPLNELVILYEGFNTYGGMSGRDLEAVARGLSEVVDESYLAYRIGQVAYLHAGLGKFGFPLLNPPGGHAVYIDARKLLPHISRPEFPGQSLAIELYKEGGIRTVEVGSLMFADAAGQELVRLALPRRVYTQSHLDYVLDIAGKIIQKKSALRGLRIIYEPKTLRHFSCKLKPIS